MLRRSPISIVLILFIATCGFLWIYTQIPAVRRQPLENDLSLNLTFEHIAVKAHSRKFLLLNWGPADWYQKNTFGNKIDNCEVTLDHSRAAEADAIMFFVRSIVEVGDMPLKERTPSQYWIFMNTESPNHAIFEHTSTLKLSDFSGPYQFNWTMTYRSDSDVPIPYGRKLHIKPDDHITDTQLREIFRNKSKFVTGAASNCILIPSHRELWFRELIRLDKGVEIFGDCGNAGLCPVHGRELGCEKTQDYKFFLAFENSQCRGYITEKFWFNAFNYSAIPVVLGSQKSDVEMVAPENSFIHSDDFDSPESLLKYLHEVAADEEKFISYLQWRHKYSIESESFFLDDAYRWKAVCDALNKNAGKTKYYPDISRWMSPETDCYIHEWTRSQLN